MPTSEQTRTETLTTTEGAVLALLAIEGERSAYELAGLAERAIGHVWAPARSGLFATLPRLAGRGLVAVREAAGPRRARPLYRLAPPGEAALQGWLEDVDAGAPQAL